MLRAVERADRSRDLAVVRRLGSNACGSIAVRDGPEMGTATQTNRHRQAILNRSSTLGSADHIESELSTDGDLEAHDRRTYRYAG